MLGRVLVAVERRPAGGTDVGSHGQTLRGDRPTSATVLACVLGPEGHHLTLSIGCFGFQDLPTFSSLLAPLCGPILSAFSSTMRRKNGWVLTGTGEMRNALKV